jgi:hypothetical protein
VAEIKRYSGIADNAADKIIVAPISKYEKPNSLMYIHTPTTAPMAWKAKNTAVTVDKYRWALVICSFSITSSSL